MNIVKTLAFIIVATIASTGCKKEKVAGPATPHSYIGKWANVSKPAEGPLDFFSINLQLDSNHTGKSAFVYLEKNQSYAPTILAWKTGPADSVIITLDIPAYPAEIWELRGLANSASTAFTANYFSLQKSNPLDKTKYGTMVFSVKK